MTGTPLPHGTWVPPQPGLSSAPIIHMSFKGFDFNKGLSSLTSAVGDLSTSVTPFAKRTRQLIEERLGSATELTALPEEYLELERRVDALKEFHSKFLAVSNSYEHETYDYPPSIKESLSDFSKTVQDRFEEVTQAKSASEVGGIITGGSRKPATTNAPPKTLTHALGRALSSSEEGLTGANLTNLSQACAKLSEAEEKIGSARLEQDESIQRVNQAYQTTLSTSLNFTSKARRAVQSARLELDAAKTALKNASPQNSSQAQTDVEKAEDDFVAAVEDAVTVMKNVLDTPEPVRGLAQFAQAQLSYFRAAAEQLAAAVPELERLQEEQETAYRESRS